MWNFSNLKNIEKVEKIDLNQSIVSSNGIKRKNVSADRHAQPVVKRKNSAMKKTGLLRKTSEIIYENFRKRRLEGYTRSKLVLAVSVLLAASVIIIICMLKYDDYFAYINQRDDYVNSVQSTCANTKFLEISVISTPIAISLLILYTIIYKRRVFLREKFKFRNFGLPMIISVWNKVNNILILISTAVELIKISFKFFRVIVYIHRLCMV